MIGTKFDDQKPRWALIPFNALRMIVLALTYGATKYGAYNWANGIDYDRVYSATMRHLTAWWEGEEVDDETNLSHLAHAGCNILFLIHYTLNTKYNEFDTRPNKVTKLKTTESNKEKTNERYPSSL